MHKICTTAALPVVTCTPGGSALAYSGFEVELFRAAAAVVGWRESTDYSFECSTFAAIAADIVSPNGTCIAAFGAMDVTPSRLQQGVKHTVPTFMNSLSILIYSHVERGSMWAFATAFSWQLWLAVAMTGMVVGVVIWLVEEAVVYR